MDSNHNKYIHTSVDDLLQTILLNTQNNDSDLKEASEVVLKFNDVQLSIKNEDDKALTKTLLKLCTLLVEPINPKKTSWTVTDMVTTIDGSIVNQYNIKFSYNMDSVTCIFDRLNFLKWVSPRVQQILIKNEKIGLSVSVIYLSYTEKIAISPQLIKIVTNPIHSGPPIPVKFTLEEDIDDQAEGNNKKRKLNS
jgi:hypothetical protein